SPDGLCKANGFILFPGRHIGEDHFISFPETLQNLNTADRAAPDRDLHSGSSSAIALEFEDADRAFLVAECRTRDKQYIDDSLQVDRSIDAQIRDGAGRQFAFQSHVHSARAVLHGRIDPYYPTLNYTVVCIYLRELSKLNVLGLRLGNFEFRFEPFRIGNLGYGRACRYLLAFLQAVSIETKFLQNSCHSRAYLQHALLFLS